MLVTFISQCEKKALNRTRRVLDAFADRIGERTWQTVITEDGLLMVKKLLRQTASKSTAVACHWMRRRNKRELVWIVGNRKQFNKQGIVPVNTTRKNILNHHWENNWTYLPLIKALVGLAALLHDWGKANVVFQNKLQNKPKKKVKSGDPLQKKVKSGDPLRHEWVSCLLLNALIIEAGSKDNDSAWLNVLINGKIDESTLLNQLNKNNCEKPQLENLPPLARMVMWLILTHHLLPIPYDKSEYNGCARQNMAHMLNSIQANWGYQNKYDENEYRKQVRDCLNFKNGLLTQSQSWMKQVKKWAGRLLQEEKNALTLFENGAWRLVLQHARLCLMLGDHYYSSCPVDNSKNWQSELKLYANTDNENKVKQKLDEHLVKVSQEALRISQYLSRFTLEDEMGVAKDMRTLKKKCPPEFAWQDVAANKIADFRSKNNEKKYGWFVVNMASTGCGKTIANAKIMRALSHDGDSLRYILALGLRTLTLQTGNEYRKNIGLDDTELAVMIGSAAFKALHEARKNEVNTLADEDSDSVLRGSESAESLLDEDVNFSEMNYPDFLNTIIPADESKKARNNKAFLYAPVLVCTIDHIIAATETVRGGKYILPYLRLLSSDLVIDEVDDFDVSDLIAIGRLVHLAGMLGRKVMISSATIPPSLAEGLFNAYQAGLKIHSEFYQTAFQIAGAWVDEFATQINFVGDANTNYYEHYAELHKDFVNKRVQLLNNQPVKRKGSIINCEALLEIGNSEKIHENYFKIIQDTVVKLHDSHHEIDPITGKKVSFGVVRMANITPCVKLAKFLIKNPDWSSHYQPIIMAYHSRQVLLIRHEQEHHLDMALKRKPQSREISPPFNDKSIRKHLNQATTADVIFIVVATPVEEIGRDHDFDWAVVEPSSYRSIIQLAGRVRRHRQKSDVVAPNMAIMQYNLQALLKKNEPAFRLPGYENANSLRLDTHDVSKLLDEKMLAHGIDAIPRIKEPEQLNFKQKLADLEHQALINTVKKYDGIGPETLEGWINECWWMTGLPQVKNKFRQSYPDIRLYYIFKDEKIKFYEKNKTGEFVLRKDLYGIQHEEKMDDIYQSRLWMNRDYTILLQKEIPDFDSLDEVTKAKMLQKISVQYGEINFPIYSKNQNFSSDKFSYSDQFGLWKANK